MSLRERAKQRWCTVENLIARFSPGSRISKHAHWFVTSDDAVLIAVVAPEEKPTVADEVLAYGLAWQGNRDLHLVLPSHMIAGTVARLPWIETEVRVWVLEGAYPQPIRTMPRVEVFEHLRALPPRVSKRANLTTEQEAWLAGIDSSDRKQPVAVVTLTSTDVLLDCLGTVMSGRCGSR